MIDKSQDMFMLDSSNIAKLAKLDEQFIKITDYYTHEIVAPNSWAKALLSEICKIIGGSQPPKEYFTNEPREGYIRLIQIRDYKTDKFATYIPTELAKRFCKKRRYYDWSLWTSNIPNSQGFRGGLCAIRCNVNHGKQSVHNVANQL